MSILSVAVFMVGFAGALMILAGLIGRRVKVPPFCRACGYSLVGSHGSERCPECGAGLLTYDSVSRLRRRRRPRVVIAGLVLLLLCAGAFGPTLYQRVTGVNPYRYVPASWLMRIASNGNAPDALDELHDRLKNGRLSGGQITALVEAALTVQADAAIAWDTDWGNIIETAEGNGQVTAEQFTQYAKVATEMSTNLVLRPRVRKGDPIPYRFQRTGKSRVGDEGLWLRTQMKTIRIGDMTLPNKSGSQGSPLRSGNGSGWFGNRIGWDEKLDVIEHGPVDIAVTVQYEVYRDYTRDNGKSPPLYAKEVTEQAQTMFTHADEPTAQFVMDPTAREAMAGAFAVTQLNYTIAGGYVNMAIEATSPPVESAFAVWFERDGKRWEAGSVNFGVKTQHSFGVGSVIMDFDADVVDVVLEPSLDAAAATVDRTAIWGERIVIKDVKVNRR